MSLAVKTLPSAANAMIPASLGARMSIASEIVVARNLPQISNAMNLGQHFASRHDFYLPVPRGQLRERIDQFSEITVPYFTYRTRPIFSREIREIAGSDRLIERFDEEKLSVAELINTTRLGLLSYNAAFEMVQAMEGELSVLMAQLDDLEDPKNYHFAVQSISLRAALDVAAFSTAFMFVPAGLAFASGAVFASGVELASYLIGRKEMLRRIAENEELRAAVEVRSELFASVKSAIERLEEIRHEIPSRAFPPQAEAQELRKAVIRENLGTMEGYVAILDSPRILKAVIGEPLRYIAVRLSDGQEEIRLASINFSHQQMFIGGERLIGAGAMAYLEPEDSRPTILMDGISESFPTVGDAVLNTISSMLAEKTGITAVMESFREAIGPRIDLTEIEDVEDYMVED